MRQRPAAACRSGWCCSRLLRRSRRCTRSPHRRARRSDRPPCRSGWPRRHPPHRAAARSTTTANRTASRRTTTSLSATRQGTSMVQHSDPPRIRTPVQVASIDPADPPACLSRSDPPRPARASAGAGPAARPRWRCAPRTPCPLASHVTPADAGRDPAKPSRSQINSTGPSSMTKLNGGAWSFSHKHAYRSRRSALPLTELASVVNTTSSPSSTEPHWSNVRLAVLTRGRDLGGTSAVHHERAPLLFRHAAHRRERTPVAPMSGLRH